MSTLGKAAATRSNLVRLRRRREQVDRGAALLRRKRESLVAELFERAKPAVDSRRAIEVGAARAYEALLAALAAAPSTELAALGWPEREVRLEVSRRDVWGIRGIELVAHPSVDGPGGGTSRTLNIVRSAAARGVAPGPNDAAAEDAADRFERLLEQLLVAAPEELFLRRIGRALGHVTRLVNTLEQRVAVSLARDASSMQRTLEEREREEHLRLKRFARRAAWGAGRAR
jgi:V/A-type H+-transporting ATPase subunit D